MFSNFLKDFDNEVKETFKDYNSSPAYKIDLLIDILTMIHEQKMKLIPE